MPIKRYKPVTPSLRNTQTIDYKKVLSGDKPHKPLLVGLRKRAGRNNNGRITVPHQGGGHKQNYRLVDFKFNKRGIPAKLETIEYDPNRSAFIALALYADGERRYVLSYKNAKVGDKFIVADEAPLTLGNRMMLKSIPVGTLVYNVELKKDGGAKLARSAGSYVQIAANVDGQTSLKMPSGEIRKVPNTCMATIGEASNSDHNLVKLGKAGRSRWKGIRPTVRGTAMNPVDHPHGGGEQKQGIGLRRGPKTRYGKQAYGVKTRTPKKYSNPHIVKRRATKRNTPK